MQRQAATTKGIRRRIQNLQFGRLSDPRQQGKVKHTIATLMTSLVAAMDLVISEEMAIKYFGRTDVVGEFLTVCCLQDQAIDVQITGVIRDLPETSHLDIDFLTVLEPSMFDFAPNVA